MPGHLPMGALPGLFESGAIDLSVIAGERKKANQCCNKQNYRLKEQGEIFVEFKDFWADFIFEAILFYPIFRVF
jgi:hypothetical protein